MIYFRSVVIFANLYTRVGKGLHFPYDISNSFYADLSNTQRNAT